MENSNFNQGGQRYDAIKHIDYLIDMVKDASSVPFSDKCSIERTESSMSGRTGSSMLSFFMYPVQYPWSYVYLLHPSSIYCINMLTTEPLFL